MRVLGLMSGTSADGVDAVLVELSGSAEQPHWTLLRSASLDYPASTRQLILAVGQGEAKTASSLLNLSETITTDSGRSSSSVRPRRTGAASGMSWPNSLASPTRKRRNWRTSARSKLADVASTPAGTTAETPCDL